MTTSPSTNGGFTLVELMVAMLIMLVGLVGLLQALNVATAYNLQNQLRDEAVQVGEKAMAFEKVRPFAQLTGYHPPQITSQIRGGSVNYTVSGTATPPYDPAHPDDVTETLITVTVTWKYKGVQYSHQVMSNRSSK